MTQLSRAGGSQSRSQGEETPRPAPVYPETKGTHARPMQPPSRHQDGKQGGGSHTAPGQGWRQYHVGEPKTRPTPGHSTRGSEVRTPGPRVEQTGSEVRTAGPRVEQTGSGSELRKLGWSRQEVGPNCGHKGNRQEMRSELQDLGKTHRK